MKPHFIGIGAQKCATTWLYNVLSDHPQISMAAPQTGDKDTKFFSYFYDRGFEWYEKHFRENGNGIVGEYSTSYFYSSDAPERIYNYSHATKLIVSLRNPVARAFSNHKHEIKLGRISGENLIFENALKNNPMYLYQSMYFTHLSRWLQFFDQEQLFIVLADDLKEKPEKVTHDLFSFLGVDPGHKPAMLYQFIHETRIPKNIVAEKAIKIFSAFLKTIRCTGFVDYLKSKKINDIIYNLNSKKENIAFKPMKEETRVYLIKYFDNENRKLADLINRDLSHWNI